MLWVVGNHAFNILTNILLSLSWRHIRVFVQKVLQLIEHVHHLLVFDNSCLVIDIDIVFGVLDLEVGLLHQGGDLFKLLVAVVGVVQHDAVEDLGEMGVQVGANGHAQLLHFLQLLLQLVQSLITYAHFI